MPAEVPHALECGAADGARGGVGVVVGNEAGCGHLFCGTRWIELFAGCVWREGPSLLGNRSCRQLAAIGGYARGLWVSSVLFFSLIYIGMLKCID